MKKNYILIVFLLLTNLFSVAAETKETLSAEDMCNVTITVDKASNIKIATMAGHGTVLSLVDGLNDLTLDSEENPLLIEPAEGAKIIRVRQDGNIKSTGGDGMYRLGVSEGTNIEITTEILSANPTITFSVDEPSHIVVKANNEVVTDISSPKTFAKETVVTISAAEGYAIKSLSAKNVPSVPFADGVYTLIADVDETIYVATEPAQPVVTFDIDYPNRVSVLDMNTGQPIDISSLKIAVPPETVLEIQASDTKYSIQSFKVNGQDKQPSGGSGIYHLGITANTTIAIRTSSTVPSVKFIVDNPENVKVHLLNSTEALDLSKTHELAKNTQLVIEPASDEVRIASVMFDGMKLTPLENGTYMTSVSTDMTIEIKTKGILPGLIFNVDVPERISVWKGTEKLDISDLVEVPAGTEITIAPAAGYFVIRSLIANDIPLTPTEGKYQLTVTTDMVFDIKTAASLTLHIIQPEGGKVSVFRNDTELHEGDKVETGEELLFKNTPDEGYVFVSYTLQGEECIETCTVSGSEDITVSANFRTIKEGYALVTFEMDENAFLVNIKVKVGSDDDYTWEDADPSQPCEIKKGSEINIYTFISTLFITSCTLNGVEMASQEKDNNYIGVIEGNAVIKVVTEQRVSIGGEETNDETYTTIGRVYVKYNGEKATDFTLPVGTTVELIAEPSEGYEFEYYYLVTDPDNSKFTEDTYTIENLDNEFIRIKGAFKRLTGINDVNLLQSHYDAVSMQIITTGGKTEIYTISGAMLLESAGTTINVSALESGMYIVKAQDRVFKIVKR